MLCDLYVWMHWLNVCHVLVLCVSTLQSECVFPDASEKYVSIEYIGIIVVFFSLTSLRCPTAVYAFLSTW